MTPQTGGGTIARHLEADPDLLGVLIIDGHTLQGGAFSRRKFLEGVESPGYDKTACPGSCFYVRLPLYPQTPV